VNENPWTTGAAVAGIDVSVRVTPGARRVQL